MIALLIATVLTTQSSIEHAAPRIVSMSPVSGSVVPAGEVTLLVTFDQPMRGRSYSFVSRDGHEFPACKGVPEQSVDGRTYSLKCTVAPAHSYSVWINSGQFRNFVSASTALPADAAVIEFSTH